MSAKVALAVLGMVILVLDTRTAVKGASEGIISCISTVIPSLLPFIFLSCWLNGPAAGAGDHVPKGIAKIVGVPEGAGTILISAVLGGYPAGAQAIYSAYGNGTLKKTDAERNLAYCNNAGPAFIFGMTGHLFSQRFAPWLLWSIHIISAFMVSIIFRPQGESIRGDKATSKPPENIVLYTAKIMCTICTWVIMFSVLLTYLDVWIGTRMPTAVRAVLVGTLELVNGCCSLPQVTDARIRFVILSGMLAFGGVCVTMQTVSAIKDLSIRYYIKGKILQTIFSVVLSSSFVYHQWYLMFILLIPVLFFMVQNKNKGRNMEAIRV